MISGVNGPDDRGRLQGDSAPESKTLWQKISKAVDNIFSVEDIQGPAPAITAQQAKTMDMSSKEIAEYLFTALNYNDDELTKVLVGKINDDNASTVYKEYYIKAKSSGETAGSVYSMRGGRRAETLVQGIVNDISLTEKEKIDLLNKTMEKIIEHGAKYKDFYGADQQQIDKMKQEYRSAVENCVKFSHNASAIETQIRRLYGWGS